MKKFILFISCLFILNGLIAQKFEGISIGKENKGISLEESVKIIKNIHFKKKIFLLNDNRVFSIVLEQKERNISDKKLFEIINYFKVKYNVTFLKKRIYDGIEYYTYCNNYYINIYDRIVVYNRYYGEYLHNLIINVSTKELQKIAFEEGMREALKNYK